jgi:hypothetical protein
MLNDTTIRAYPGHHELHELRERACLRCLIRSRVGRPLPASTHRAHQRASTPIPASINRTWKLLKRSGELPAGTLLQPSAYTVVAYADHVAVDVEEAWWLLRVVGGDLAGQSFVHVEFQPLDSADPCIPSILGTP